MLDKLGNAIKKATDKIANAIFLDKEAVESIIKELQRALLEADVNVILVKQLSDEIRKEAMDERVKGVEKKEHIIKILHDKLEEIIGRAASIEIKKKNPTKVMLIGLYGTGKTTTIAKLSNYYNKRGYKTCILGLDVHRPAAREQLEQLGKKNNLRVFTDKKEKNPVKTYKSFKKEIQDYDVVFIDTAGRHSLDEELVKEIKELDKEIDADYKILTIAADIGQAAKNIASSFQEACNINGVIITRMDSSAKGGGALTACHETKAPIFFVTTGEKINDIEVFEPARFISRVLGMGDLNALLERVKSAVDEKTQRNAEERFKEGKFDLVDLYQQLESMENVGTLDKIMEFIPGLGKAKIPENILNTQQDKMKKWKHAINSMTQEEIENPEIMEKETQRLSRISKGSGVTTSDIRSLLKQYRLLKEFMGAGKNIDMEKGLSQKDMMRLAKKFGKVKRMRI